MFHTGLLVILDSGFYVLKAIIELRKRGIYASALIKKRQYWRWYIRGDKVKEHFDNLEVGATDSWEGCLDDVPFHVYAMKEPNYVMKLMSAYGANARTGCMVSWTQCGCLLVSLPKGKNSRMGTWLTENVITRNTSAANVPKRSGPTADALQECIYVVIVIQIMLISLLQQVPTTIKLTSRIFELSCFHSFALTFEI